MLVYLGVGVTPYYASWGFHPRNLAWRTLEPKECKNPMVEEFVTHQLEVMVQVKDALYQAQRTMEEFANRGKNDINFVVVGQEVCLNTQNLGKNHFMRPEEKMRARFIFVDLSQ